MNNIVIPYDKAKPLIKEADVLLFRGEGTISWLIQKYSQSPYSHAALAHWDGQSLMCVEFREFKGGRIVNLEGEVGVRPGKIDVFRVIPEISAPVVDIDGYGDYNIRWEKRLFDEETALAITEEGKELTGRKYGWKLIWKNAASYLPLYHFSVDKSKENGEDVFMCSKLVTYTYRKHYSDPNPFLNDDYTRPGDLARSPMFQYLFTLG